MKQIFRIRMQYLQICEHMQCFKEMGKQLGGFVNPFAEDIIQTSAIWWERIEIEYLIDWWSVFYVTSERPWASYQIRQFAVCVCAGNTGNVFPATVGWRSWHASQHVCPARAVMHAGIVNWRFPLKSVSGKTLPAFQAHAQPVILRIWQEAHIRQPPIRWHIIAKEESTSAYNE